jgi:hypothetical protein
MKLSLIPKVACVLLAPLMFTLNGASQSQTPILDAVANKVIAKYQTSTCQQLWMERESKAPPTPEKQKMIAFLKSDPQMRTLFLNKVAAPIANKMFECGMIP